MHLKLLCVLIFVSAAQSNKDLEHLEAMHALLDRSYTKIFGKCIADDQYKSITLELLQIVLEKIQIRSVIPGEKSSGLPKELQLYIKKIFKGDTVKYITTFIECTVKKSSLLDVLLFVLGQPTEVIDGAILCIETSKPAPDTLKQILKKLREFKKCILDDQSAFKKILNSVLQAVSTIKDIVESILNPKKD